MGLFGNSKDKKKADNAMKFARHDTKEIRTGFEQRRNNLLNQSATDTDVFRAGQGVLKNMMLQQGRRNDRVAARYGGTGSEVALAQGNNMAMTRADFLRRLMLDSEQNRLAQLAQADAGVMNSNNSLNVLAGGMVQSADQRAARRAQMISGALQSGAMAFGA